ncbi:MAG: hypothetical protein IPM46_08980 [Flavobacteriales bacterium]|nr:hypothetical protein [Flavobacteriales bacterium]
MAVHDAGHIGRARIVLLYAILPIVTRIERQVLRDAGINPERDSDHTGLSRVLNASISTGSLVRAMLSEPFSVNGLRTIALSSST